MPRSLLIELLRETVALEYPDKFFTFLDQLSDLTILANNDGHDPLLELALTSGVIEDTDALARIRMNLALASVTPKLEAFYNYFESRSTEDTIPACESWVDWYGTVACDTETLTALVGQELDNCSKNSSAVYVPFPFVITLTNCCD